jgi:transposase InsO family protein
MSSQDSGRRSDQWARLRFSIIGQLLADPPRPGELQLRLRELSQKCWRDPFTAQPRRFGASTIERWFYKARGEHQNPFEVLGRRLRKDAGQFKGLSPLLAAAVRTQYGDHGDWSMQLHYDNLAALRRGKPELGALPSYATLVRYMHARGMFRKRRHRAAQTDGALRAAERFEQREVRSYEAEYAHALWHADFHHGSRHVLTPRGQWAKAYLLGFLDDHTRLAAHVQWYLEETAECFVHGLMQALQKRGLPRELMTDNGAAMQAAETCRGLERLGIQQTFTLPYSPYQNGKQECFWGQVEGRLLPMLAGERELTLSLLNEATQAWVELEYNHKLHSELGSSPVMRLLSAPSVVRECGKSTELTRAFRAEFTRRQRRSDGTISFDGCRYEVPSRYRHLQRLRLAAASWDKSTVDLLDSLTGNFLCALYPLDKAANGRHARRRRHEALAGEETEGALPAPAPAVVGVAPLLKELMIDYRRHGLPPAYLPKHTVSQTPEAGSAGEATPPVRTPNAGSEQEPDEDF